MSLIHAQKSHNVYCIVHNWTTTTGCDDQCDPKPLGSLRSCVSTPAELSLSQYLCALQMRLCALVLMINKSAQCFAPSAVRASSHALRCSAVAELSTAPATSLAPPPMPNGLIAVLKPEGWTSSDVVNKVKCEVSY
jgi:hypothetical protein